jgi:hypothetical protein
MVAPDMVDEPEQSAGRGFGFLKRQSGRDRQSRTRGRKPSREEATPKRARSRPGPIPTLGELARQASWVHVYCEARDCHHSVPLKLAEAIARYGEHASSDAAHQDAVQAI